MVLFAFLFGLFLHARESGPDLFARSRADLDQASGVTNTILLLTGSFLVVLAVRAARGGRREVAAGMFVAATACALGFATIKIFEYTEMVKNGMTPGTNDFYMYFFVLTGLHLAHLIGGAVVLVVLWRFVRKPVPGPNDVRAIESGATFWHMVDLLWIVLFPLFYLVA